MKECPVCGFRTIRCPSCGASALAGQATRCSDSPGAEWLVCSGCALAVDGQNRGVITTEGALIPWKEV